MKVFILGGDGFCGWPTALYLSRKGYDITIVDNFSRRKIDLDLETFPIQNSSENSENSENTNRKYNAISSQNRFLIDNIRDRLSFLDNFLTAE